MYAIDVPKDRPRSLYWQRPPEANTGSAAAELFNHETLWLKNFLSKQTQQTYRVVFREFCQLGRIASSEALRQVTPAEIISYRDHLIEEKGMRPRSVRNRLAAISSFFKHLINAQVVALFTVKYWPSISRLSHLWT